MITTLSSKGQVVIPASIREQTGLTPGAKLQVRCDDGNVVLEPEKKPFTEWLAHRSRRPVLNGKLVLDRSMQMPPAPKL